MIDGIVSLNRLEKAFLSIYTIAKITPRHGRRDVDRGSLASWRSMSRNDTGGIANTFHHGCSPARYVFWIFWKGVKSSFAYNSEEKNDDFRVHLIRTCSAPMVETRAGLGSPVD